MNDSTLPRRAADGKPVLSTFGGPRARRSPATPVTDQSGHVEQETDEPAVPDAPTDDQDAEADESAGTSDAQADEHDAEQDIAAVVDAHLAAIEPGWAPGVLQFYVESYFRTLADYDTLTDTHVAEYCGQLVRRLKELGYSPLPRAKYQSQLDVARKKAVKEREYEERCHHAAQDMDGGVVAGKFMARPTAADAPAAGGMYLLAESGPIRISNFTVVLDQDQITRGADVQRVFAGNLSLLGRDHAFAISAADYANPNRLLEAIYESAGPEVQILCKVDLLRTAISAFSPSPATKQISKEFGWAADKRRYRVPGGVITADGMHADPEITVDLTGEGPAEFLGMSALDADTRASVKKHIVDDFLNLHDRRVTYPLLATIAAALLYPFAEALGRYYLWLTGLTGSGKSFLGKLAMNFFGSFPLASARFVSWSSTCNYLQRQGYPFKDCLYFVDDYKPEVTPPWEAVRLLQAYSDGGSRGRLRSDATANISRPIRGFLLSTGEDVPQHAASVTARGITIRLPNNVKDTERGQRCIEQCQHYSGVTADFIQFLLANGLTDSFSGAVMAHRDRFYADAAGKQNDLRAAGNLALMAAAFESFAAYLTDVWPEWQAEARWFAEYLAELGDAMLGESHEQQESEIFLDALRDLLAHDRVRVEAGRPEHLHRPKIGRKVSNDVIAISTSMAMEAVQELLRRKGTPPLRISARSLIAQLRAEDKLVSKQGTPLANDEATRQVRVDEGNAKQCFFILEAVLYGRAATTTEALAQPVSRPSARGAGQWGQPGQPQADA